MVEVIQLRVGFLATFAYVLADPASRTCALIDPAFETGRVLDTAKQAGYTVTHVINTHAHSDHCAGNAAVLAATKARLCIHPAEQKRMSRLLNKVISRALGGKGSPRPDILVEHGDVVKIGGISLNFIHTPGHTEGGICILCENNLFTGDTLFVGCVGRTDLPGGSHRQLLESIRKRLYVLDDDTVLWPGHDYGPRPFSTIGQEKRSNPFTS